MPPRGRTASGVSRRGASPRAATKRAPWIPALSTSLSEPINARRFPSGDQARPAMLERPCDTAWGSPPWEETMYASVWGVKSRSSRREETKAI